MSTVTFITVIVFISATAGILYTLTHPYRDCKRCDGGKLYNYNRTRYGKGCVGSRIRRGRDSCHGAGEQLSPEIKLLRKVGIGTRIEDPVAKARGE